jgi:hypothetical protein
LEARTVQGAQAIVNFALAQILARPRDPSAQLDQGEKELLRASVSAQEPFDIRDADDNAVWFSLPEIVIRALDRVDEERESGGVSMA